MVAKRPPRVNRRVITLVITARDAGTSERPGIEVLEVVAMAWCKALGVATLACAVGACAGPGAPPLVLGSGGAAKVTTADVKTGTIATADDPTGLSSGRAAAVGPPPPPLTAVVTAVGQATTSDLVAAMGTEQDIDVYADSFDRGSGLAAASGIVSAGAGNIVSAGAGNYRLLVDSTATVVGASALPLLGATTSPAPSASASAGSNLPFFARDVVATPTPAASASASPVVLRPPGEADPAATRTAGATEAALPIDVLPKDFHPKFQGAQTALADPKLLDLVHTSQQLELARASQVQQRHPELAKIKKKIGEVPWLANADGTITKTFVMDVARKVAKGNQTRHVTFEATVQDTTDVMLHHQARIEVTLATGVKTVTDREVALLSDGSRHVELKYSVVHPNGARRIVTWSKNIDLDGKISGTGKLETYNKAHELVRAQTVTLEGTLELATARANDPNSQLATKVDLGSDGTATAVIHDPKGATGHPSANPDAAPPPDPSDDAADLAAENAASAAAKP